ncbi:cysteine desulfurase family protein [Aureimonas pseudogalii]|uniref:Cysteine desulfurase n=1 Tax=Aureimonas pseudogalii TaxID=1744844 RepID=A0A7W6H845_9HYPH|nr:aminotransferase class V-fold PLP-dependent enzyme [Aureimonas pseudogalii]MBB4000374.1 cysteine desulfurase [Aureimonas pseudogalii]
MTVLRARTYLDYNASAPLLPAAREALVAALERPGNPSSVHGEGRAVRHLLERARANVATLVDAVAEGVVFTSGATEAAVTCLTPHWQRGDDIIPVARLAVLDTDHPCLREGGRFDPNSVTRLPVDSHGVVVLQALRTWLAAGPPGLLAFSLANSETGVIQPALEMIAAAREAETLVVVDAVQAVGRIPVSARDLAADALILSAHKIGGPTGTGAFVLASPERRPFPLLTGGAQETRQRAGTEAVASIAAFGAAAAAAGEGFNDAPRLEACRLRLEAAVCAAAPGMILIGGGAPRLPQTIAFQHSEMRAETLQIALDLEGFAVSAGSACSSGKVGSSHVLEAMAKAGAPLRPELGSLRVSFGAATTDEMLQRFSDVLCRQLARMTGQTEATHAA